MDFMLNISMPHPAKQIGYQDKIMLIGSCFTEHIGGRLANLKFSVLQNPNGILFDPLSVCSSLNAYIDNKVYCSDDFFYLNELWHSWDHHSLFSGMDACEVEQRINESTQTAHQFLREANFLIITLGSSFSYHLTESAKPVANCHRAPAQWFRKTLTSTNEIIEGLNNVLDRLRQFNSSLNVIFTVSPVRHIRDGVVENNRSKARLIEAVHTIIDNRPNVIYFPAYELVIDVLRDYRFYDIDLVHPNYPATEYVFEQFVANLVRQKDLPIIEELKNITTAFRHKPFQPNTKAHQNFLKSYLERIKKFKEKYPEFNLQEEEAYFSSSSLK